MFFCSGTEAFDPLLLWRFSAAAQLPGGRSCWHALDQSKVKHWFSISMYIYIFVLYVYIYLSILYIYILASNFSINLYIYYISWIYDFLLWSIHFKVAHMRGDFIRKIVIARKWLPATWRAVEFCRWTTWISCSITRRGCWCSVPKPSWIRHDEAKYEMWAILIQIHPCPVGFEHRNIHISQTDWYVLVPFPIAVNWHLISSS